VTAKTRAKSPILTAMRETTGDLHRLGLFDKHKMDRFDALCLRPMTCSARQIRKLRSRLNISQDVLARVLNTDVSTVRKWDKARDDQADHRSDG
jgi:putative transcriptional regulator